MSAKITQFPKPRAKQRSATVTLCDCPDCKRFQDDETRLFEAMRKWLMDGDETTKPPGVA